MLREGANFRQRQTLPASHAASVREIAAVAHGNRGDENLAAKNCYGFGLPATVFGRVIKCTIRPTGQTSHPSTTTSVRFGELRFFESFMIQMATKSQMAIMMSWKMQTPPNRPAAAAPLSSVGVGLSV